MMYNKRVQDCFFSPKHIGVMALDEPMVIHYRMTQPNQRVIIDLYLQASDKGLITKAAFKSNGNPYVIAGMEWLCSELEGAELKKVPLIEYQLLIKELDIPMNQYSVALQLQEVYNEALVLMKRKLERFES